VKHGIIGTSIHRNVLVLAPGAENSISRLHAAVTVTNMAALIVSCREPSSDASYTSLNVFSLNVSQSTSNISGITQVSHATAVIIHHTYHLWRFPSVWSDRSCTRVYPKVSGL